jgi:RHS repeat-associated protein
VGLRIDDQTARTDATGRFLIGSNPGHGELLIDGGNTHGVFEVGVDLVPGRTTVLSYVIWLPRIDLKHAVMIPSPTVEEIAVTTPLIPGLELRIPPGTVIRDHAGKVVRRLSLTPIPLDRPPFPLPESQRVPLYFTAQPGGAYFETPSGEGARFIYPNMVAEVPGWPFDFWNYDADERGWYVYGQGQVSDDRQHIRPDPGVFVYELTGAMTITDGPRQTGSVSDAEPVDLTTGTFTFTKTDLALPDVIPISLTRTYQSSDAWLYRAFGSGFTNNYDLLLVSDRTTYDPVFLVLPGGRRVTFRASGSGWTADYSPTIFAGATLQLPFNSGWWQLYTRDGTLYQFPEVLGSPPYLQPNTFALASIQDRYGNRVTLTRDANVGGNLTTILSPHGRSISLMYEQVPGTGPGTSLPTPEYRVTSATDNLGRTVRYTYTSSNQLETVQDARSVQNNTPSVVTRYGGCGLITQIQDARGITYLTNSYYETVPAPKSATLCSVKDQTLTGFQPYHFDYDEIDVLCCEGCTCGPLPPPYIADTTVTDPRGTIRHVVFDASVPTTGFPVADTRAQGRPEEETITYNDGRYNSGRINAITDALNRQTTFEYDARDNIVSITRMAGSAEAAQTRFTYEYPPISRFTPSILYSRLASVTQPGLPPTTIAYYANGVESSSGPVIGSQVVITDPTGVATAVGLTQEGQVGSIADALGQTVQFGYEAGDLTTITDPKGNTMRRLFDAGGRVRVLIDSLGNMTRYDYDPLNNLTQITTPPDANNAAGGIITFGYDNNSNLTSVTDQRRSPGAQTIYEYDNMDRLMARKDPLYATDPIHHTETFTNYDFMGNVGTYVDRRGNATGFNYDRLGRVTSATFADGSTISYPVYDNANRLLKAADSLAGTIVRAYDNFDHLTCESKGTTTPCTGAQPEAVTYTYDPATGRRSSMTVSGQSPVTYGYDNADRLTQVTQGAATVTITPDALGRRGSVGLPGGFSMKYGYDSTSRISSIQYKQGTTVLGGLTYTPDAVGNVTQVGGDWTRVILPATTNADATYDLANRLISWNGTIFTPGPDENGNLKSGGSNTYNWNARNQLSSVSGSTSETPKYDAFGRRTQRMLTGGVTFTQAYLYDGLNPITVSTGGAVTNLLTGLNVDEYFAATDAAGTKAFLTDALGSTLALADSASPPTAPQYAYEPFGRSSNQAGSVFQFTGRENDGIGLYYYRARYYHPTFGRFISEDPLGTVALVRSHENLNRSPASGEQVRAALAAGYPYARNNPVSFKDPLGLWTVFGGPNGEWTAGVGGTAGFGGFASSGGGCTTVGGFGTIGATAGWNGGVGWNVGFAVADANGREQFFGPSVVQEWTILYFLNIQALFTPSGQLYGGSLGLGFGPTLIGPFGTSSQYTNTGAFGTYSFGGRKSGGPC